MTATATVDSPLGPLTLVESEGALTHLRWGEGGDAASTPLLKDAAAQLAAYFTGTRTRFELPLAPRGNTLQQQVFALMSAIPFGETRSYGDLARKLGTYGQPIGQACGANTIPIIIPCHRILSAEGLGGYSGEGGVETKIWLLRHENAYPFLI
ncbi:MAG: methylated-DNA--[protein]-cysteine S-methyltransferase [Pseudomonadota bacterium]